VAVNNLWNFIQFQVGWFAVVLGAAAGYPWWGAAAALALLVVHLWLAADPWLEGAFLLLVGLLGWLWESLVFGAGLVQYPGYGAVMAPLWMAALWMNFASTLDYSLAWMQGKPVLAAVFGGVGGPLAFVAGEQLGAIVLVDRVLSLGVIGAGWLVVTPLLLRAAQAWQGGLQAGATRGGALEVASDR